MRMLQIHALYVMFPVMVVVTKVMTIVMLVQQIIMPLMKNVYHHAQITIILMN